MEQLPKMSQNQRLLMWLQVNKSISPKEAWGNLGIYRLSARIKELREQGHDIRTIINDEKDEAKFAIYTYVAPKEGN